MTAGALTDAEKAAFGRLYARSWPQVSGFRRTERRRLPASDAAILSKLGVSQRGAWNYVDLQPFGDGTWAVVTGRDLMLQVQSLGWVN